MRDVCLQNKRLVYFVYRDEDEKLWSHAPSPNIVRIQWAEAFDRFLPSKPAHNRDEYIRFKREFIHQQMGLWSSGMTSS